VVAQVRDEAEQFTGGAVDGDVVLHDPDRQPRLGPVGDEFEVGRVRPVGQPRADAGQPDVRFHPHQQVRPAPQDLGDEPRPQEVAVGEVEPAFGEHVGVVGGEAGGQGLLAVRAGAEGRAEGAAGGAHGGSHRPDLGERRAVVGGPRGTERLPVRLGRRHPGLEPVQGAQQQAAEGEPGGVPGGQLGGQGRQGGQPPVQPLEHLHAQAHAPAAQHLPARRLPRPGPGHPRQQAHHGGHHLPVARAR
jgi:hypothetical protein